VYDQDLLAEPSRFHVVIDPQAGPTDTAHPISGKRDSSLREGNRTAVLARSDAECAVVEVTGTLVCTADDAHPLRTVDRFTFYRDRAEIGFAGTLLNPGAIRYLQTWGHELVLATPDRIAVRGGGLAFDHLVDINLMSKALLDGCADGWPGLELCWADLHAVLVSDDFVRYGKGAVTASMLETREDLCHITLHRTEPFWQYRGTTSRYPIDHLLFLEGQRRAASFRLLFGQGGPPDPATEPVPVPGVPAGPRTLAPGSRLASLKERVLERALTFIVPTGEHEGLIAGGYCHLNDQLIEHGVSRADYAEYLYREALRSGRDDLYDIVLNYARRFADTAIFRSERRPESHGAVRNRARENQPDPVRSMRGPTLLLALYEETGEEALHDTALEIGAYLLRAFPARFARQGAVARELATLHGYTGEVRYLDKLFEVMDEVQASQTPAGAWYEHYTEDRGAAEFNVYQASLFTRFATEKPEMSSYNIVGIIDAADRVDLARWNPMLEKACRWLLDCQDGEGAWRFPARNSPAQWGHGLFQDSLAMLRAHHYFGDDAYLEAADRSIAWAERTLDDHGYIPAITRPFPHSRLEASLTYFYGLEALSLRAEAPETSRGS